MRALVDAMHARGQHWMPLVNAGIAAAKGYAPFEDGTREGVWIKDDSGADFVGQVCVAACITHACAGRARAGSASSSSRHLDCTSR